MPPDPQDHPILLVEDDPALGALVAEGLTKWGYPVRLVTDFGAVDQEYRAWKPHLILMDVNLPRFDGFHWCRKIREESAVPILFVSARDGDMDLVMGIGSGGDDYLAKPFSLEVLVAKVQALLRRAFTYRDHEKGPFLEYRGMRLNTESQVLTVEGVSADLTRHEYRLLLTLLKHRGTIVDRDQLIDALWHGEVFVDDNTLTVNINRLRKRLEGLGLGDLIVTKKQQGYLIP